MTDTSNWPWLEEAENWPAWLREAWHKAHFGATATTTDIRYALRLLAQAAEALEGLHKFFEEFDDWEFSDGEDAMPAIATARDTLSRIRAGDSSK